MKTVKFLQKTMEISGLILTCVFMVIAVGLSLSGEPSLTRFGGMFTLLGFTQAMTIIHKQKQRISCLEAFLRSSHAGSGLFPSGKPDPETAERRNA